MTMALTIGPSENLRKHLTKYKKIEMIILLPRGGSPMEIIQIDWVVVVIAAIVNMIIGYVWYSKWLFGSFWHKFSKADSKHKKQTVVYAFFVSLFLAYFLARFEALLGVTNATDGMLAGFYLWLGFSLTTEISPLIWDKQPVRVFLLHAGHKLLAYLVMGGLIGS